MQLGFPGPEVRLFGQPARGAQLVEHAGVVGMSVEEGRVEVPQPTVGIIVKREPALTVEHGDPRRQLVEGPAMRLRHPHQRRAQCIGFAGVDGDGNTATANIDRMHVVDPSRAAYHDRHTGIEAFGRAECALHVGAVVAVEQFKFAADRIGAAGSFGRARVSRIGVAQSTRDRFAQIGQGAVSAKPRSISVSSISA